MAKMKKTRKAQAVSREPPYPPIFYSLHALLEAVQSIASHEDELCTLLHEVKTSRALDPAATKELQDLLARMSAASYGHDLEDVRRALPDRALPEGLAPVRKARPARVSRAKRQPASPARKKTTRVVKASAGARTRPASPGKLPVSKSKAAPRQKA